MVNRPLLNNAERTGNGTEHHVTTVPTGLGERESSDHLPPQQKRYSEKGINFVRKWVIHSRFMPDSNEGFLNVLWDSKCLIRVNS